MNMLITAKENRIKALNELQRRKDTATCARRLDNEIKFHRPIFRTARFDFSAPYLLT